MGKLSVAEGKKNYSLVHQLTLAILSLPGLQRFAEEKVVADLYFNDGLYLGDLAPKEKTRLKSNDYFKQADTQFNKAIENYKKAQLSEQDKDTFIRIVDEQKSQISSLLEDSELEDSDYYNESTVSFNEQNDLVPQTKSIPNTFFYASSVPHKKKRKFEEGLLSVIKPQGKRTCN